MRRGEPKRPRTGHPRASQRRLDRSEEQPEIEPNQVDVSHRQHHFALEYHALVEDVAQDLGEVYARITKQVVEAHEERSPTKW